MDIYTGYNGRNLLLSREKNIVIQITRDTFEIIIRENFWDDQFEPQKLRFQNVGVLYFGANVPKQKKTNVSYWVVAYTGKT